MHEANLLKISIKISQNYPFLIVSHMHEANFLQNLHKNFTLQKCLMEEKSMFNSVEHAFFAWLDLYG